MRLTVLGGGGFRVPLVYGALLGDHGEPRVDEVTLYDVDAARLRAVRHVLGQMAEGVDDAPEVRVSTELGAALTGADFVFSAIRVGGLEGRTRDEHVALDLGVLGQETTGPGGVAYGLRTVPEAMRIAEAVVRLAPHAWVINFTNPAGMVTEAMQTVLGRRVVGICDSPIALARRAATALGLDPVQTRPDYLGLNHLGWLRGLIHDGEDVLPRLLADQSALRGVEEARLFGVDWVQALGALPNEYLYYYYFARDAIASIRQEPDTRGDYLLRQQRAFYEAVAANPAQAYQQWQKARAERDASYMAEVRNDDEERDAGDISGGGYEGVALAFMAAVMRGVPTTMILNVRNGTTLSGLSPDGVVEVPCHVDAAGAVPLSTRAPDPHQLGLMNQVKAVEQLTIRAALARDVGLATTAFALHPLVDSVTVARELVRGYGVDDLFRIL